MKETAKDYLFRSLKWLGGVFAVTVGILAGADQLMKLGWPVEWYVIAFLSVGIFMQAILLAYLYKQLRGFEAEVTKVKRSVETAKTGTERSLERLIDRSFSVVGGTTFRVGAFSFHESEEIEVHLKVRGTACLRIRDPEGNVWKEESSVSGSFIRTFEIPGTGDYVLEVTADQHPRVRIEVFRVRRSEIPAVTTAEAF